MHTPVTTSRWKATLPTTVEGPTSPLWKSYWYSSATPSKVAGALEPRAAIARFAHVAFQTSADAPPFAEGALGRLLDVILSMATASASEVTATPTRHHSRPAR